MVVKQLPSFQECQGDPAKQSQRLSPNTIQQWEGSGVLFSSSQKYEKAGLGSYF